MKQKLFYSFACFLIFNIIFLLQNCSNTSEEVNCVSCEAESNAISFNFSNEDSNIFSNEGKLWVYDLNGSVISYATAQMETQNFAQLLKVLDLNSFESARVFSLALYFSDGYLLDSNDTYSSENIKGIGVYYLIDDKPYHKLYSFNKGITVEIEEYSFPIGVVATNTLRMISEMEFHKNHHYRSYAFIDNISVWENYSEIEWHKKKPLLKKTLEYQKNNNVLKTNYSSCGEGCIKDEFDYCKRDFANYCERGGCGFEYILPNATINENIKSKAFDTEFLYEFRDDFLAESIKGRRYIDNYYQMSDILIDEKINISPQIAGETIMFMFHFSDNLSWFLDLEANKNKIVLTENTSKSLLNLTSKYKSLSNNNKWVSIISQVESDIVQYTGKTVSEINADFE